MFSKSFLRAPSTPLRFCVAALLIAATAIMLTACGGGGGTTTPPATGGTYTATSLCASGPALTSTVSQAAANALVPNSCPAVPTTGVTVNVVGGMLVVNGLPPGVTVATSSFTAISGGSTVVFTNGALTSGTLLSGATYTYSGAQVTFTNAPNVIIAGTFVSPVIVVCIAPAMLNTANACISAPAATGYTWNSAVKVWVADRGIYITSINTLPAACLNINDACYLAQAANGTIKFAQGPTNVMFAVYQTADGYLNTMPLNSDGTPNNVGTSLVSGGASGNFWDYVVGTVSGIIRKTSGGGCAEFTFGTLWGASPVTCPVGP